MRKDNFHMTHGLQKAAEAEGSCYITGPWDQTAYHTDPTETAERAKHNAEFWKRFLAVDASVRRTAADWAYARQLAGEWNTCACGSINDGLPREGHANWAPKDGTLHVLGMRFMRMIRAKDLPRSRRVFREIQKRGVEVLKKLRTPRNQHTGGF